MSVFKDIKFDSHKNHTEKIAYMILTFDLTKGTSSDYRKIEHALKNLGFRRSAPAKMKANGKKYYDVLALPNNTFLGCLKVDQTKNVNRIRDMADRSVKQILEFQRKWGGVEQYRYFLFISKTWSWFGREISVI